MGAILGFLILIVTGLTVTLILVIQGDKCVHNAPEGLFYFDDVQFKLVHSLPNKPMGSRVYKDEFFEYCKENKMILISELDLTKIKNAAGDQGEEMWEILNENTYYWLKDEDKNAQERCKYVYFQNVTHRLVITTASLCGVPQPNFSGICIVKCY